MRSQKWNVWVISICVAIFIAAILHWGFESDHYFWALLAALLPVRYLGWKLGHPGTALVAIAVAIGIVTSGKEHFPPSIEDMVALVFLVCLSGLRTIERDVQNRIANTDSLTKLLNRRGFEARLAEELEVELRRQPQLSVAIACLDCNNFKAFNDTRGHRAGDQLLIDVGAILARRIPGRITSRLSGDEFCVAWIDCPFAQAQTNAAELLAELHQVSGQKSPAVTFTMAVGVFTGTHRVEEMIDRTDRLMLDEKRAGKESIVQAFS